MKMFKQIPLLGVAGIMLVLSPCSPLQAQHSGLVLNMEHAADLHNEHGMFNGASVMVDGNLVVSNSSGVVNYSYPISNNAVHGTELPVSLNYCGSVKFTAYRHFFGGSDQAEQEYSNYAWSYGQTAFDAGNTVEYDSWTQFSVQRPAWIVSVGGFAVQVLHHNTDLTFDYESVASGQMAFQDAALNWNVFGYDVSGGLNLFQNNDDRDKIHLLRGDGSVLELRNPIMKEFSSEVDPYKSANLWTGYYYPNEPNPSGYALVEIDNAAAAQMHARFPGGFTNKVGFEPRIVRWFPGNGLEYVFYEEKMPFGKEVYEGLPPRGNQVSGTSMFYLRKINNVAGQVTQIDYSRHYDVMWPSAGRAVVTELHGHRFSFSNGAMSIDAMGRNIKAVLSSVGRGNASSSSALPLGSLGYSGLGAGSYSSWNGMIDWIIDPVGRRTDFEYQDHVRIYQNFNFPVPNNLPAGDVELTVSHKRLSKVKTATFDQVLEYHTPNSATITSSFAESNTSPPFAVSSLLNPIVSKLEKRDKQNKLLVSVDYTINNQGTGTFDFIETVKDYAADGMTLRGTVKRTYTYDDLFLTRVNGDSRGTWNEGAMTYLALLNTTEEGAGEIRRSYKTYGNVAGLSNYHRLPLSSGTSIKKVNGPELTTSDLTYAYQTGPTHDWGGNTNLQSWFGAAVTTATTTVRRPDFPLVILKKVDVFEHRPTTTQSVSWQTKLWNKFGAISKWLELENHPDSVNPYKSYFEIDTFTVVNDQHTLTAPYRSGLQVRSHVENVNGDILAGARAEYPTSYQQEYISGDPFPYGLLPNIKAREYTIGLNGVETETMNYLYVRDGARRGQLARSEDAFGAVTRIWHETWRIPGDFANKAKRLMNDGTVTDRGLFSSFHIFAKPIGATRYVRQAPIGATTAQLTACTESTYFGLSAGSIDENGWYSALDYDQNGRLRHAILPGDFPTTTQTYTLETTQSLRVYGNSIRSATSVKKECDDETDVASIISSTAIIEASSEFTAARPIFVEPTCDFNLSTSATRRKQADDAVQAFGPRELNYFQDEIYTAYIRYTAAEDDLWQSATRVDGATLEIDITGISDQVMLLYVKYQDPADLNNWKLLDILAFNYSPYAGRPIGVSTFFDRPGTHRITLPPSLVTHYRGLAVKDQHAIKLEMATYGGRVELGNDDANAPRFLIDGEFERHYDFADKSLEYVYNDAQLQSTVQVKVDDEQARYSNVSVPDARRTEKRHEFGADYRVLKSSTVIGNPAAPQRVDESSAVYSGQGLVLSATDAVNNTTSSVYDDFGRPLATTSPDGTSVQYSYEMGLESDFGINDQDFLGACLATFVTDENNVTSASFTDAFGRLRREVMDYSSATSASTGLNITTKYFYDHQDRLTSVISPSGDQTTYYYDAFNRIRYKSQPDLGTISYRYDKLGRMRFVQDQRQNDLALMAFYQYDDLGRLIAIGEAQLSGADSSGNGSGEPGTLRRKGGGDRLAAVALTNYGRFTDLANPDVINAAGASSTNPNVNPSLFANLTQLPPQIAPVQSTTCMPQSAWSPYQRADAPAIGPFLVHAAQMPSTQALLVQPELNNFEDAGLFPQFIRTVVHYDELPPIQGVAFMYFPSHADWNRMAPTGVVRNLKGREAAVAYRNNANEPFHYNVMSYDERGRVEALIRYTENIGFDATYYEYNAQNQVISIRNVDALRQHAVWYGTDHNGRINNVWSTLGSITSGTGLPVVQHPTALNWPAAVTPDLTYTYTTRGQINNLTYNLINWDVNYTYDVRNRLTNLIATGPGPTDGFSEQLSFDAASQITQQVNTHLNGAVVHTHNFSYDRVRRLTDWTHVEPSTVSSVSLAYDKVGNRLSELRPGNTGDYSYSDPLHPNQLATITDNSWNTAYWYNENGATNRIRKTWAGGGNFGPIPTEQYLTYDMNGLPVRFEKGTLNGQHFDITESWRYRTNPSGEREQKRQWWIEGTSEAGQNYFWTYYQLAGTRQHAVWNGIQRSTQDCNESGALEKRVTLYPTEYLSFGTNNSATIGENPTYGKHYLIRDHLGSTRLVISQDNLVESSIEYEPFGETFADYAATGHSPRLGWIGKERDAETGYGNFGVRNYDFEGGRFLSGDPLWEQFKALSPYHYSSNDPVFWKDPSGESGVASVNHEDKTIEVDTELIFYGEDASSELAKQIVAKISAKWNELGTVKISGVDYKVSFKITFQVVDREAAMALLSGSSDARQSFVRLEDTNREERTWMDGNVGSWQTNDLITASGEVNYVPAHEFVHGYGVYKHTPWNTNPNGEQNIAIGSESIPKGVEVDPVVTGQNFREILRANDIRFKSTGTERFNLGRQQDFLP